VIKVYQLLAHGRWFFPGTPASSTTKTGRHDIAEILLKVALNTKKSINQHPPSQKVMHSNRRYRVCLKDLHGQFVHITILPFEMIWLEI
jgi:hypothetical protein